jgi:hypothetical protein
MIVGTQIEVTTAGRRDHLAHGQHGSAMLKMKRS